MKHTSRPGIALFLVMTVIFAVLTIVIIGAAIMLNNLDAARSRNQAEQARQSAVSGIERVKGLYKADPELFDGCSAGDCVDIENATCATCSAATMVESGAMRYQVAIASMGDDGIGLLSTGYRGPYATEIESAINFFLCGQTLTDRDGYEYPTTLIGTQCWLGKALLTKTKPDGTCINGGSAPCADASIADDGMGRACYANDEANCALDGALYRLEAAMNGSVSEGAQGICPDGWHVPTDAEWYTLEVALMDSGGTCDSGRLEAYDCSAAGTRLQAGGDVLFNAALAGRRDNNGSDFFDHNATGRLWTSSIYYAREFGNGQSGVSRVDNDPHESLSLRCLKDS